MTEITHRDKLAMSLSDEMIPKLDSGENIEAFAKESQRTK